MTSICEGQHLGSYGIAWWLEDVFSNTSNSRRIMIAAVVRGVAVVISHKDGGGSSSSSSSKRNSNHSSSSKRNSNHSSTSSGSSNSSGSTSRFDARYDDSPTVRALPPSLLTANREALEGQNHLKVPNRLQNGLSSIQRTGLWFFWGTQNVLLPNGAGLPDPDAVTAWLARSQATKKSRGNTKKTANRGAELQLDAFGSVSGPMRHSLAALAGADRRGGRALLIVNET